MDESNSWQAKAFDLAGRIFSFLTGPSNASWWSRFIALVLIIVVSTLLLILLIGSLNKLIDGLTKLLEAYKESGLGLTIGREKRAKLRRRRQFCRVLASDLANLAKAENWNDQYFTDLEAEVETEGGYYSSGILRLFKRRSHGLRIAPSLIQAIQYSTERAVVLVGEPGSGKSVALRHLANQFAERGIRSSDPKTPIPLYVNLRELGEAPPGGPTADLIRQFVLDNIRRGDADTAAYVSENWNEYRDKGTWFFLFDSFDEIPAVLHAPTGSPTIHQHAEALRQFLTGMGDCRGVLASREFKGPDKLPWQKFRILSLSQDRQYRLVDNSFLTAEQKLSVYRHLAEDQSGFANNPLFLTLICRYVREENRLPTNDHDLLFRHIVRLANREPDYILRTYNLTPSELMHRAEELAISFGEYSSLSLAPTQDEIAAALASARQSITNLDIVLAALVDVKIGRSDVREARLGDRRFAFSHRRYQETLFVQHLASNPGAITPRELLTSLQWREYAVTLLQTQSSTAIRGLVREAEKLLHDSAANQRPTPVLKYFGSELTYFDWQMDPAVPVLLLLQEGLGRRLSDIPASLMDAVEAFLGPRWEGGDAYDRCKVLELGGLLPQSILRERLAYALFGTTQMKDVAFTQAVFLMDMPATLGDWFRKRLSNDVLQARKREELLRVEALASRLPSAFGAKYIVERSRLLRTLCMPFKLIGDVITFPMFLFLRLPMIARSADSESHRVRLRHHNPLTSVSFTLSFLLTSTIAAIFAPWTANGPRMVNCLLILLGVCSLFTACLGFLFAFRAIGSKLSLSVMRAVVSSAYHNIGYRRLKPVVAAVGLFAALVWVPGLIVQLIYTVCHLNIVRFAIPDQEIMRVPRFYANMAGLSLTVCLPILIAVITVIETLEQRRWHAHLHQLQANGLLPPALFFQASDFGELRFWLRSNPELLDGNMTLVRSLSRFWMQDDSAWCDCAAIHTPLYKYFIETRKEDGERPSLRRLQGNLLEVLYDREHRDS